MTERLTFPSLSFSFRSSSNINFTVINSKYVRLCLFRSSHLQLTTHTNTTNAVVRMTTRYGCYVGNIDATVPLDTVRQVFAQCGTILDCSLNGRDSDPYRFGFIDFGTEADRERALKFNGVVLAGRPLKVGVSKGNVNKPIDGPRPTGGSADASAALLMQLVQSGAVNPANLTPEQQRLLTGALLGATAGSTGLAPPAPPMGMPPPMPSPYGAMPPMSSPYGMPPGQARQPYMRSQRPAHNSPNPQPTEELLRLREAQRKTFFDVIRKEADSYKEKLQRRKNKHGSNDGSDSSSSSDDDEPPREKSRHEEPVERARDSRDDL